MAQKDDKKRLGKKHRQASTRPKKGRAPKATPTTGAVDPRKRKVLSTAAAKKAAAKRVSRRSPEFEARKPIASDTTAKKRVARANSPGETSTALCVAVKFGVSGRLSNCRLENQATYRLCCISCLR